MIRLAVLATLATSLWGATAAQEVVAQLRATGINPDDCYQVRDLAFTREDLRFYFTEGVIAFAKPAGGHITAAVFSTDVDNGDAELLVFPPSRGERASLSAFTQSPNLNEHFTAALLLFTDDTGDELRRLIQQSQPVRKSPDRGLLLAERYNSALQNLSLSFGVRFVNQRIAGAPPDHGFFYAAIQGNKLSNFDAIYDQEAREQIYLGQIRHSNSRTFYDTWTSFPSLSFRTGKRTVLKTPAALSNYRIEAKLGEDLSMDVTTHATLVPSVDSLKVVPVEITNGMQITSVRINGQPAELFGGDSLRVNLVRRNESEVILLLPQEPLEKGRAYEVVFEHNGKVVREAGRDVYFVGARGNWYPQLGMQYSSYDISFTYPASLQMAFPGDVREDKTDGNLRTTRRVTGAPIRVAGFNLGKFEKTETVVGPLKVEVYANKDVEPALVPPPQQMVIASQPNLIGRGGAVRGLPDPVRTTIMLPSKVPDPTARLDPITKEVASSLEFLQSNFGPPALNNLKISPIPGTFGQGFPGLVYLSTLSYLSEKERPTGAREAEMFYSDILLSHEVAHQWWGNVVAAASPQDNWLMEALANYSALMLLEKKKGTKAMGQMLEDYKNRLLASRGEDGNVDGAGPIALGGRLEASLTPPQWNAIVYGKGTWILHMLRRRIGDESFLKLLGRVAVDFRNQTISVKQFLELASSYLPKGSADPTLEGFFEHWVEGTGIPTLVMKTSITGKAPNVKLTIIVTQSGVDETASIPVPVEVQTAPGRSQTYWLQTGGSGPATQTVTLRAAPLKVSLDPGGSVLRN